MVKTSSVGVFMAALVLLSLDAVAGQACDPSPTGDAKTDMQIAGAQMATGLTDQAINCRLLPLAKVGDAEAHFRMGQAYYYYGNGEPVSRDQALG